jgi:hypothetical protein
MLTEVDERGWSARPVVGVASRVSVFRYARVAAYRGIAVKTPFATVEAIMRHPLGWDLRSENAVREFVRAHPFVAFRPASGAAPSPSR